ncbi:transferase [Yersinia pestis biovar Orientalis str. F1991016]|nr:transferase [Yersinia pestis biovar Orientalis str. F1991016]
MGRWWRYKWITFHPSLTMPEDIYFRPAVLRPFSGELHDDSYF